MPALDAQTRFKTAGRNDDCPCGSGKKYKKCHLHQDEAELSKALAVKNAEAAKEAAASGEEHVHTADCKHDEEPKGANNVKMAATPSARPSAAPKPMSHKPVTTPRKAV